MPDDPNPQAARKPFPPLDLLHALVRGLRDETLSPGEAAALRRLDPARPDKRHILPLMRLLASIDPEDRGSDFGRLTLIANAVALARGAHDKNQATGAALHALGVSEQRLLALLAADFATLTDLLPRLARRAAAASAALDWHPLVLLAWHADRDEAEADKHRRRIASTWLRAEAAAHPTAA